MAIRIDKHFGDIQIRIEAGDREYANIAWSSKAATLAFTPEQFTIFRDALNATKLAGEVAPGD